MGRTGELQLVSNLLSTRDASSVLYLGAPTGMGKTALLDAIAARINGGARPTLRLSCSEIAPAHAQIEEALHSALEPTDLPPVILLDDFERHARLERWYRTKLLPRLPVGTLFVFAGRHRLERAWAELDGALRFHRCELGPLDRSAAQRYGSALGVAPERAEDLLRESHGVPLLLRHAMEIETERRCATADLNAHDSALHALFTRMLHDVPTEDHRRALWAISLPRRLSPRLLAASLESASTREYYRWLSRRTYVTTHDDGMSITSPFRQAVLGDLQRCAPAFYGTVLWRAGQYLMALFGSQRSFEGRQAVVGELLYMQRRPDHDSRMPPPIAGSAPMGEQHAARARQLIIESAHSTRAGSAAVARLLRSPAEFAVTLDERGEVTGVIHMAPLPFEPIKDKADPVADPDIRRALAALDDPSTRKPSGRRRKHLNPRAIVCSVWLPPDATEDSPNLAAAYRVLLTCTLATPDLRVMTLISEPDSPLGTLVQKAGLMGLAATERDAPPLLFRDNGRDPPLKWLQGQLAIAIAQGGQDADHAADIASMSRHDFSYAVREALQRIGDENALTDNPLVAVAGTGVRHLIKQGLELLASSAHSREDADRLREHYGIDGIDAATATDAGAGHLSASQLATAEDRLIATLWQEYVQRTRAGTPS